ncbi:MAG TPA: alginate lyase family protein, partial [Pyrinomonadaceae bacterium]|nr:alginate lyase family protein [Pyrinomonadaceae bacterium]
AALELIEHASACTPGRLALVLKLADTHCRFTLDNNEFSYVATGNHYLTNVAGLFFVATMLPELKHAAEWQDIGLRELLREIELQILPDGADWESSTGYHKFVTEMLLVCLILADKNGVDVAEGHRVRLRKMLEYLKAVIRPDGGMPLIGDCDGSQFLPIVHRDADDVRYMLDLAAVVCKEDEFKTGDECSPEVLWLYGKEGIDTFDAMAVKGQVSNAFQNAGSYVLRHEDLYLLLNANDVGLKGRGSHSHNDALSIEVSVFGRAFVVDPGSYVYNLDREARHRFRSTAYHSTLMIDDQEQNAIDVDAPFVSSNDARPRLLEWRTGDTTDTVSAEHYGYAPLVHRRTVELVKAGRFWNVTDDVAGDGRHEFCFSFHLAPGLEVERLDATTALITDPEKGSLVISCDIPARSEVREAGFSSHYGKLEPSQIIRWVVTAEPPLSVRWLLVPMALGERLDTRLAHVRKLTHNKP